MQSFRTGHTDPVEWDPPRRQARRFVLASCGYWFLWGVTVVGVIVGLPAISTVAFIGAFPLVFITLGLGYQIDAGVAEGRFLSYAFGWNREARGRRGFGRSMNMMRPAFYRDIARASGWPVAPVLAIQAGLLIADLALFAALIVSSPS